MIVEMPFKVGTFNVDTPAVQLAFRNHLICSEVKKAEPIVDGFVALSRDEKVDASYKILYDSVGNWLRGEYDKTMKIFRENMRRTVEKMDL